MSKLPDRIATGCGTKTIPNPAVFYRNSDEDVKSIFEGLASTYDFKKQATNAEQLRVILQRNNTDLEYVSGVHVAGDLHINHTFVATTYGNRLLWYKYVRYSAQGGQNHVYVAGMRIKLSYFLNFDELTQDRLLTGSKAWEELFFDQEFRDQYDESKRLWS